MKYIGALHCHSDYSYDGKESLSSIKKSFMDAGLSFCFITEHTDFFDSKNLDSFLSDCQSLSDNKFVFIPGFEVPYKKSHILLIATRDFLAREADIKTLEEWRKVTAMMVLAHPVRNNFEVDNQLLQLLDGVEIWNQQYDGKLMLRPKSLDLLKALQHQKNNLKAIGGLDFHRLEHLGSPFVVMDLDRLTLANLVESLVTGQYQFGSKSLMVDAKATLNMNFVQYLISYLSIIVIKLGKGVNRTLSQFGLKLPKRIKTLIRKFI